MERVWDGVADGVAAERVGVADRVAGADVVAGAVAREVLDAEARADVDVPADAPPVAGRAVVGRPLAGDVEGRPPVGDGVRVAACVPGPDEDVSGVGVKVDGTEDPPAVQAEAATTSRTAPAARRPAASQASGIAAGVLSRIFMDPPRTRVRYTR